MGCRQDRGLILLAWPRVGSHIVGYLSSHATTCRSAAAPPARGRCIGQVAADFRQSAGTPFFAGCEACRGAGGLDLTSKSSAASASIRSAVALIFLCVPALAYR